MPFHANERFQAHCRFCSQTVEADSISEALTAVVAHEREKHMPKLDPGSPGEPPTVEAGARP